MEKYICENVFVPLRSGPVHKSEMVSQVLFGEKYTVTGRSGSWIKILTLFDSYSGWIDSAHLQHTADIPGSEGKVLTRSLICYARDKTRIELLPGCEIFNPDVKGKSFTLGDNVYTTSEDFGTEHITVNESVTETAMRFINSPYLWGGRLPSGIDCSGFTQLVYKIHGIALPRDSRDQSETGIPVSFIDEAEPGDLVFFDNERGKISHVGLILSPGIVIHSSGRVRTDNIDHQGIYNIEIKGYTHKLRMIKRIL